MAATPRPEILAYYTQQSAITDPGPFSALFDALPNDVPGLARTIQGLIVAPYPMYLNPFGIGPDDIDLLGPLGYGVREIAELLRQVVAHEPLPLAEARPPRRRLGANCRNFGTLLVSMLRCQGVPARLRVGFAGYLSGQYAFDHRIAEYWDAGRSQWALADAMVTPEVRAARAITVDVLDLRPGQDYFFAGEVWQQCRAGAWDPLRFADSPTDRGMPPIRYALLHDFLALAKLETLGCDDWGELITKPEENLTAGDLAFLDRVAALTAAPDEHVEAIRELVAASAYGCAVQARLAAVGPAA